MAQSNAPAPRAGGNTPFVGRDAEFGVLDERLSAARAGDGGVMLIAGEPGIGKTRLVTELAERARADGWQVLVGRAYQAEGLPPYLPFVEALRDHVRTADVDALRTQLGGGIADVALLVEEIQSRFPATVDAASPATPERYQFFESIASFLLAIAPPARGLLIVLDDLHWADTPTLLLMLHVARRLRGTPVLIVGTYRHLEVTRGHPLAGVLGELVRERASDELLLSGLTEGDIGRYVETIAGTAPPPALVRLVSQQTAGNPLFMAELVRLLMSQDRLTDTGAGAAARLAIPPSIQQVVGQRLDRLSTECIQALTFASVLGREFTIAVLARALQLDRDALFLLLEEAEEARIVAGTETPGRYTFTHPLIRETLYTQVLTSRRVRLHRQAGETIEAVAGAHPEPYLAELAHHFVQAAGAGVAEKAIAYARRAGDRSLALLAYEEATRLYTDALSVIDLTDPPDEPERCRLLLSLGEAQTRAGETAASKESFVRAAELARSLGLADVQARAALGYAGYRGTPGLVNPLAVSHLEEAAAALAGEVSGLHARVLGRLAMELFYSPEERERRQSLSDEAVAVAQQAGDRAALAAVLVARHYALHTPENLSERLATATELVELAEASGDLEAALLGHYLRVINLLELGTMAAAAEAIATHRRLADRLGQPLYRWRSQLLMSTQAQIEGRFADARQLALQALASGQAAQLANTLPAYGVQVLSAGIHAGGIEPLIEGQKQLTQLFPTVPAYRSGLALAYRYLGRNDDAREQLATLAAEQFSTIPRDDMWLTAAVCVAEVTAYLEDRARATVLYDLLLPLADRGVVVNAAIGWIGPVSFYLGELAATLERWDAAEAHFEESLTFNERMGARAWLAHTQYAYALMLERRGREGDHARAAELIGRAHNTAEQLDISALREPIGEAHARIVMAGGETPGDKQEAVQLPDGLTSREVEVLRMIAAGGTSREIAEQLVLSVRTVEHHTSSIYKKIGARRRTDAITYALRHNLIGPDELSG